MKQSHISLGTALVALSLLAGCGKKQEVKLEKAPKMMKEQVQAGMPEESYVFDDNIEDVDQFAFAPEDMPQEDADHRMPDSELDVDQFALTDYEHGSQFDKVQFEFNSDKINNDQQAAMHKNIEAAKDAAAQGKNVEVRAYRCQMGDAVYNMALSQRSANNVKKEMAAHGVPEEKIIALGCGQEKALVSSNATDRSTRISELSANRRVEISTH